MVKLLNHGNKRRQPGPRAYEDDIGVPGSSPIKREVPRDSIEVSKFVICLGAHAKHRFRQPAGNPFSVNLQNHIKFEVFFLQSLKRGRGD